ncbi:MAG: phage major capsid protein [bacterium]|nr:phage major capsid protein [bacterium]
MTYSNEQILAKLDEAYKSITVDNLGESILAPEKFNQFVRAMQHRTTILPEARFIEMQSHVTEIDRVGFVGRVLTSGNKVVDSVEEQHVLTENEFVKPQFATNKLIAKEMQAVTGIRDRALRRNIERGGFETTLINLFGEAAGRDLEEWAIFADTDLTYAQDKILWLTDGWVKKAKNKVYGAGVDADFNKEADDYPEQVLKALLDGLPKQYLLNRAEWRFYVPYEIEDGYRDLLKARGTALGDRAQTTGDGLYYKGIPVVYCPMLERAGSLGRVAMLQHPDNMAWGVFHEVTIEREREAKARRTDFVLTIEADCHYEDENGAVVALVDKEKPAE